MCARACVCLCNGSPIVGTVRRDCKTLKEGGGGGASIPDVMAVTATSSVCTPVEEVCRTYVSTGQAQYTHVY